MNDPYLAVVTWLDASRTESNLTGREDIGIRRESVGWVLNNVPQGVVLAMTRDELNGNIEYERGFTIPRPYIVKVRRLTEAGSRKTDPQKGGP